MQRSPLYSRARRSPSPEPPSGAPSAAATAAPIPTPALPPASTATVRARPRRRWQRPLLAALLIGGAAVLVLKWPATRPPAPTLQEIERTLRASLMKQPLPSLEATAAAKIGPSVVRVVAYESHEEAQAATAPSDGPKPATPAVPRSRKSKDKPDRAAKPAPGFHGHPDGDDTPSIGTGVVIQDNGTILTNLHVVEGAQRVKVQFHDGLVSDAQVLSADRSQDLAVIRAVRLPDDLQPATLRGTGDLRPGDHVVAVGFPFGIGPSVSSGVVSGLEREFRAPDGERTLKHLIQFDAAANPGNSGGPLVTQRGEVVGIVTAILNPTPARTFLGIGFAVPIENAAAAVGMPPF